MDDKQNIYNLTGVIIHDGTAGMNKIYFHYFRIWSLFMFRT